MFKIIVNNDLIECPSDVRPGLSYKDMLSALGYNSGQVMLRVNGKIFLSKDQLDKHLERNDHIDIVTLIAGG